MQCRPDGINRQRRKKDADRPSGRARCRHEAGDESGVEHWQTLVGGVVRNFHVSLEVRWCPK